MAPPSGPWMPISRASRAYVTSRKPGPDAETGGRFSGRAPFPHLHGRHRQRRRFRALPRNPAHTAQGQAQLHATDGGHCGGNGSKASYATTVRIKGGAMVSIRNRSARAVTYGSRPKFRSACRHFSTKPASAIGEKRPPRRDPAQGETFWHAQFSR